MLFDDLPLKYYKKSRSKGLAVGHRQLEPQICRLLTLSSASPVISWLMAVQIVELQSVDETPTFEISGMGLVPQLFLELSVLPLLSLHDFALFSSMLFFLGFNF
ncbi:hypothetical protein CEXT_376951 [Caerostris extrusa]|uniref:Uncharacterized protein n=1 Tax=Caerostris extrusa TaxID=172846 RepID=A0AAV4YA04_CAEEX|nr:hypothetical protein CEXT_376951 [Caerostris extrusa]